MIAVGLVVLWALFWGLWRREFGRCRILGKTALKGIAAVLMLPVWLAVPWSAVWWPYQVAACLGVTALVLVFFVVGLLPGGRFTDDREVLIKYGPFGLGYVLAHRFWRDRWNTDFCNGPDPAGEIFLGSSVGAVIGSAWFLVV